ncbi:MAG: Fic family protein [Cellvibrionales bacterium]|nr:Fic family protein [Cellvibrionales bacterium]
MDSLDWGRIVPLIGPAAGALAGYDSLIAQMQNPNVLLAPLLTQESVLSSKIEGTNVTMGEALEIEAGGGGDVEQSKRDDAEEVLNYRAALRFASAALRERPFSLHLLREAHAILLDGVRGRDKGPGAFRDEQNWIGPRGCAIEQASFVPIPQEHLLSGLEVWAAYFADNSPLDPLVQLAVIHFEFEAIHPFKDGNGRLGRMLIPLFLMERGILSSPSFYMSGYLEARREEYVDKMLAVSRDGAWTDWCVFFLEGIIQQARQNQRKAQAILNLYRDMMQHRMADLIHSQYSGLAVDFLFSHPVFSSRDFVKNSGVPQMTAQRIIRLLRDADILRIVRESAGSRPAVYAFPDILNIAEGEEVF